MRLSRLSALTTYPLTGDWVRVVAHAFSQDALNAAHTTIYPSRFNAGPRSLRPFQTLYFAEDLITALFEARAALGSPTRPLLKKGLNHTLLSVRISLSRTLDLCDIREQDKLDTNAQELTGDWEYYQKRDPSDLVPDPVGESPTQILGEAIRYDTRAIEGFVTVSAKLPNNKILVLLPENISNQSYVDYTLIDPNGNRRKITM